MDSTETGKVCTYTYCAYEEKQIEASNMNRFLQILITMSNQIQVTLLKLNWSLWDEILGDKKSTLE